MIVHMLTILLLCWVALCLMVGYTFPIVSLVIFSCVVIIFGVGYTYWFVYKWVNSYFGCGK